MKTRSRLKFSPSTRPTATDARRMSSTRAESEIITFPELSSDLLSDKPEVETQSVERESEAVGEHSAYRLYLQEIGQTKLLTPQEEVSLAKRIQKGDKKAREQMIKANLRLVVKIARDYEGYGVPLLDLISEGNIGLIKAVERYDPTKGAKLSTYSAWWIKQAIRRALSNQSKTIRLPVHVVDKLTHMRRAEATFFDEFGREPTDDELAAEIGMPAKRIRQYRQASMSASSLDAPLGDEDSNRVGDIVADERAESPSDQLEGENDTRMVREALQTLNAREKTILQLRFGLDDNEEQTLEELGTKFGLTRERIRQIQELALRKLRKKMAEMERAQVAA